MADSDDSNPIVIRATEQMLRSPNSHCVLLMMMRSECKKVYDIIMSYLESAHGRKGDIMNISDELRDVKIERALLSCDAKAAQLTCGCNKASAFKDFCMFGCKLDKNRYER